MTKYKYGDIVKGTVTGIESYGIFVSFNDNVTGLIHISQISDSFVNNVFDYAYLGETITAMVVDFDSNLNRLKLSLKLLDAENPYKKKKKVQPIKETKNGFSTLGKCLDEWISNKENEILNKKTQKNNN